MAITLVELMELSAIELAEKIDNGEEITSTLVKSSISLLKMDVMKVKGIGLKLVGNSDQKTEYENRESSLYSRINYLNGLYRELLDSETGSKDSELIFFIGGQYDREME